MSLITISLLWDSQRLITFLKSNPGYPSDLLGKLRKDNIKINFSSMNDIYNLILQCNWAHVLDGKHYLTDRGNEIVKYLRNSGTSIDAGREQLFDIVKVLRPKWAGPLKHGRLESMMILPTSIVDIFKQLKLYHPQNLIYDSCAVEWWDKIAASYYSSISQNNIKTGRIGERLTILFEKERTLIVPKWESLDSDKSGYDILSQIASGDNRKLCIEVKTSQNNFTVFYFSRGEWNFLQNRNDENYKIHFWRLYEKTYKLTIINRCVVNQCFPEDSIASQWQKCIFEINNLPSNTIDFEKTFSTEEFDLNS